MYYNIIGKRPFQVTLIISLIVHIFALTILFALQDKDPEIQYKTLKIKLGSSNTNTYGSEATILNNAVSYSPAQNAVSVPTPPRQASLPQEENNRQSVEQPQQHALVRTTNRDEKLEEQKTKEKDVAIQPNDSPLADGSQNIAPSPEEEISKELKIEQRFEQASSDLKTPQPEILPSQESSSVKKKDQGTNIGNSKAKDAKNLVTYEQMLPLWLNRFREYPEEAKQLNIGGTGNILIMINRSGQILRSKITKSTGNYILDKELMEMVKKANPVIPVPENHYKGKKTFSYQISFDFIPPEKN